ncbi:MAG: O-antigen ligase family protein [Deltaproteobacteria bacterium]|nr:O-antigen ligase family protein [Deltaproteobacteria bacterium]
MGRKNRGAAGKPSAGSRSSSSSAQPAQKGSSETSAPKDPLFDGAIGALLFSGAALVVALVALYFSSDVNRVFDVPKAVALKTGGSALFLAWVFYGVFGRGYTWRSIRLFFAPVMLLTGAIAISTLLSIDPVTSLYGVYERQFGLQGFLGCVGLFVVTATSLRSKRGALLGLSVLLVLGSIIGAYGLLQARGLDPYRFFLEPKDKVYSTLGNATFAGNALALVFPISSMLALTQAAKVFAQKRWNENPDPRWRATLWVVVFYVLGFVAVLALQLMIPSVVMEARLELYGELKRTWSQPDPWMVASLKQLMFASVALVAVASGLAQGWFGARSGSVRRAAAAVGAGGLLAMVIAIVVGLFVTRTRGAWVASAASLAIGSLLLPSLFPAYSAGRRLTRALGVFVVVAGVAAASLSVWLYPNHLVVRTLKSIPAAFDSTHTVYGQGQGTRRYLWTESIRVLTHHRATLARQAEDLRDAAQRGSAISLEQITSPSAGADLDAAGSDATGAERHVAHDGGATWYAPLWRRIAVYVFGIGMETYRYAFMSHKSMKLEALDPMTNHDNPHNNYLYMLASFGLLGLIAYLWLLARLLYVSFRHFRAPTATGEDQRLEAPARDDVFGVVSHSGVERGIAFGVLTSFFSYAVYSIAGFDSVACSVFLYFLLGCAAVYLSPPVASDRPRPVFQQIRDQWAVFRGRAEIETPTPKRITPVTATVTLALSALLLHSAAGGVRAWQADYAFALGCTRPRVATEDSAYSCLQQRIRHKVKAIKLNPDESYYRQTLANLLANAASERAQRAARAGKEGQEAKAQGYIREARAFDRRAEALLYSALNHAWAPENIFISLFQLYYGEGRTRAAERALERALEHSPHLGAVRANLAVLKLERRAYKDTLRDCRWVLKVDPRSVTALRTCGRAYFGLGKAKEARTYLERARQIAPADPLIQRYLSELDTQETPPSEQATRPNPN